ncbi:MAG: ABC transporter permease [Cohaesibacter sp.]|nr:ABC transporter permease [Cohaesibacter sp.]
MLRSIMPRVIWDYRYFIFTSVLSDFKNQVARSKLGFFWLVAAPLSQVLIYAFVLSSVMSQKLPGIDSGFSYSIYLLASFQFWFLFVEIFNRSLSVFIDNASVIKKISFPRLALPLVVVITALINNMIFLLVTTCVYYVIGFYFSLSMIWFPVILAINIAFACGLGITLGVLNVFIRDISQISNIVIQFLFWLTPLVYTIDILPPAFQTIIKFNPLYWLSQAYHDVIVYGNGPNVAALSMMAVASVFLVCLGYFLFKKSSAEMVDVL